MAKPKKVPQKPRPKASRWPAHATTMTIVAATQAAATQAVRKVRFGGVTVSVAEIDAVVEARNIKQGQLALKRASKALAKPGVVLVRKPGVPYFHADPKNPNRMVRELDGQTTVGIFVGSKFKPLNA